MVLFYLLDHPGLLCIVKRVVQSDRLINQLIELLRPDVIVKGGDWAEKDIVGADAVRAWGGRVAVMPEIEGASTTNIIEKVLRVYGPREETGKPG